MIRHARRLTMPTTFYLFLVDSDPILTNGRRWVESAAAVRITLTGGSLP